MGMQFESTGKVNLASMGHGCPLNTPALSLLEAFPSKVPAKAEGRGKLRLHSRRPALLPGERGAVPDEFCTRLLLDAQGWHRAPGRPALTQGPQL